MASPINSQGKAQAFSFPLPGKPKPDESWDPQVGDQRLRVVQKGQKGNDCSYVACNRLRQRIGKNPPPGFEKERELEASLSKWRKKENENVWQNNLEAGFEKKWMAWNPEELSRIPNAAEQKELLREELENGKIKNVLEGKLKPEEVQKVLDFVTAFVQTNTNEDLINFANNRFDQKRIADAQSLLVDLDEGDYIPLIDQSIQKEGIRAGAKRIYALIVFCMNGWYNFQQSHWHPMQPIRSLIHEIEQHGPHKVTGYFGMDYYKTPPFKLKDKVEGCDVFGWRPGTLIKVLDETITHTVIIVGARTLNDAEHVYFIDPNDPSDPADPYQKMYVISYNTLRGNIVNLAAQPLRLPNGDVSYSREEQGENFYAVHGKKPAPFSP
jgi:hypothetical protein